jgi:hypothetical protein
MCDKNRSLVTSEITRQVNLREELRLSALTLRLQGVTRSNIWKLVKEERARRKSRYRPKY